METELETMVEERETEVEERETEVEGLLEVETDV